MIGGKTKRQITGTTIRFDKVLDEAWGTITKRANTHGRESGAILDEKVMVRKLESLSGATLLSALDEDDCYGCKNCCWMVKNSKRATLQIILAFCFIAGWIVMGVLQMVKAYESENEEYLPQKILRQKKYFSDHKLQYNNPYFYFWFDIEIESENLTAAYNCSDNSTTTCLKEFFNTMLTFEDNVAKYNDYTYDYNAAAVYGDDDNGTSSENMTYSDGYSYSDVIYPYCEMVSFNTTTGVSETDYGVVKDYDILVNRYGDYYDVDTSTTTSDYFYDSADWDTNGELTEPFGVLVQIEISDVDAARGRYTCDSSLDISTIVDELNRFTNWFELWMFMSRTNYTYGVGFQADEPHMRSIFRSDHPVTGVDMRFFYEEVVLCSLDGSCVSEFFVETNAMIMEEQSFLLITLNPLPKVFYYKEFIQYTYLDSLSSIGGFWTIFLGVYLTVSTFIAYYNSESTGKGDLISFGILPMLSKAHCNSEEISYLRKIVMTLLNLQNEHLFRSVDSEEMSEGEVGELQHQGTSFSSVHNVVNGLV